MRYLLLPLYAMLLAACTQQSSSLPVSYTGATANWPSYGGQKAQHYSALDQINRENIQQLELAWTHNSGDISNGIDGDWGRSTLQVTPIVTNGSLYYCTPFGRVFSLDPETGSERWVYDPQVKNKRSGLYPLACRGVSYWQDKDSTASCSKRIFYATRDAEVIALDADTGEPCESFGSAGRVSLQVDITNPAAQKFYPTSPPAIINDTVIFGTLVPDNETVNAASGVIQAFDAYTGERRWVWEPLPDDFQKPDNISGFMPGTPNAWAPITADEERGLVYVPMGNPSPDLYGGERNGIDYYGSSTVALNAETGTVAWHFQAVHHDVWDYDIASQPQLFQIDGVANGKAGVLQATKMGHVFLLDRDTGKPLYPVEERPVPQDGVAGEQLSPTQPFPTHPVPLHPHQLEIGGMIGFDAARCKKDVEQFRNEGIFTPPSLQGSVAYPATLGGINWGATAIDPVNGMMYVNQMHYAMVVQLIPRAEYDELNPPTGGYPDEFYPMKGSAYGAKRTGLMSFLGSPCVKKPWGTLSAVNLKSGQIEWKIPLGTTRDLAPWPLWFNSGTPNMGGAVVTAGKLLFIGATTDHFFRAFDVSTGEEVWRHRTPTSANATPLSYRLRESSKQYVVVAAGGHGWSDPGDSIMAFALPD
ncbi:MAG: pyrroloquinoline quinone-dependent dehydrogenase [Pseudomonadales bacterium]